MPGGQLDELERRAGDLPVETVRADVRDFDLGRRFPCVLAPMQTVQLLGGRAARADFLRCARAHLEPGGVFAIAVADEIETFDDLEAVLPDVREVIDETGGRVSGRSVIHLDRLDADMLEADARDFTVLERRSVPGTDGYVGAVVVMLSA